jgi:hypothetical protein
VRVGNGVGAMAVDTRKPEGRKAKSTIAICEQRQVSHPGGVVFGGIRSWSDDVCLSGAHVRSQWQPLVFTLCRIGIGPPNGREPSKWATGIRSGAADEVLFGGRL